jgi:putative transposase
MWRSASSCGSAPCASKNALLEWAQHCACLMCLARVALVSRVAVGQQHRPRHHIQAQRLLHMLVAARLAGSTLGRARRTPYVDFILPLPARPALIGVSSIDRTLPKDDLVAAAGCSQPWIAFGIGETILLDNGLEFHSPQFQLAGWELGMDIEYCRVRMPWLKPMVERFFANLDHLSLKTGRVYKPMANVQHLDPMKDAAITFSDFAKGLLKFVVDVYPFELNNRRLQTAYDCFKEGLDLLPPPAFPTSFDQLDLIAAMSKTLTVAQGGIEMVGLNYSSPELAQLKRSVGAKFKTLVKWNPDDLSFVYMQDPRNQQWMPVPSVCGDYTNGLSWIQHRLIRQHARDKHVQGGTYERLVRARQELHECWMNPLVRRNRRAPDAVRHCDGTGLQLTFATADGHLAAAHKNGPHQRFSK